MLYNKIIISSIPWTAFAHHHETTHYEWSFAHREHMMEIAYIDKGDVIQNYKNGCSQLIPEQSVLVNLFDRDCIISCDAPLHRHYTVGVSLDYQTYSISEKQMVECSRAAAAGELQDGMFAIVPLGYLPNQKGGKIHNIIQRIIREHAAAESYRNVLCSGLVLELLSEITRESIRCAYAHHQVSPGSVLYSEQAIGYISSHIGEKITVADIAKEIGISGGYLSNTFKAVTSQTLIEYISRVKINRVKELLVSKNLTLREAGERVGIYDENYLSRIFKKYTGMTARDFKLRIR